MAYDFSKEKREVLLEIERNSTEQTQITQITKEGSDDSWIDFRIMYKPDNEDEFKPTKKGVRISGENTRDIVVALLGTLTQDEVSSIFDEVMCDSEN